MALILASDHSVSSPPYTGDTQVGSTLDRGAAAAYEVIWDCNSTSGGGIHWDVYQVDAGGSVLAHDETNTGTTCATGFTYTHNFVAGAHHVSIVAHLSGSFSDWTGRFRVLYSDDAIYCQYGTEPTSTGTFVSYLTPGLLDLVLTATGELWAIPFVTAFWFTSVNLQTLCGDNPPTPPILTLSDFVQSDQFGVSPDLQGKLWQWLQARLWSYFCQCKAAPPGGPPPVPQPPPSQLPPDGVPDPIDFSCDDTDVCTILAQLATTLVGVQANLRSIRGQVDLIQRQHVPFAYVPGTTHSGLSGAGTFAVQGILGLSINATSKPGYLSSDMAPIASWFKLGEISWGTADGWLARRIVTHDPHLFLDLGADITQVAYQFEPGVVASILELVREP